MKLFSTIVAIILFAAFSTSAQSHKQNKILTMHVLTSRVDTSGFPDMSDSTTMFNAQAKLFLADTVGITKIVVTLKKSKDDSSALLQHDFVFDGTPGGSLTYSRNKRSVELGLGNFPGILHLYAEVKVQKTDGTYSDPVTFSR